MPRRKLQSSAEMLRDASGEDARTSARSRSRSRSRSPGWKSVTPTSKKERRAHKRAEKERLERERERVGKSEGRGAGNSWVGIDRLSGGLKDVYVVCEDIRNGVRVVKKEASDEAKCTTHEEVTTGAAKPSVQADMRAQAAGKKRKAEEDCVVNSDPFEEMDEITRDMQKLLLSDANKVTRWISDRVLAQARKYECVVRRLVVENAQLQGRLQASERLNAEVLKEVCESIGTVRENVSKVDERVGKVSETVERMDAGVRKVGETCEGMRSVAPATKSAAANGAKKSYAVIVRGEKEGMSCAEVQKRMAESVAESVDIRVRAVRPVRGGGVVVETMSDRERTTLTTCPGFARAGLKVEEPRKIDPRIVVYDVPCEMSEDNFMQALYEKNLSDLMPAADFKKRVRLVKRFGKEGKTVGNVILEVPIAIRERILNDGRVFVGWRSYKVSAWERVSRCFACLGYGHRVRECKSERLCWRCGKAGHSAAACKSPEDCGNCRARKLPSAHSAMSPKCPEYERRLSLLRSRIHNG